VPLIRRGRVPPIGRGQAADAPAGDFLELEEA